jgi:hypothetical protein
VLESGVLARCPSCRNTFSTARTGHQQCPVCGKPLLVPEQPSAVLAVPPGPADAEPAGTPWERRKELGLVSAWLQTIQQALLEPGKLFSSARLDRGAAQLGFAVLTASVFSILEQLLEHLLFSGQREQLRRFMASFSDNPNISPLLKWMISSQNQPSSTGMVVVIALFAPLVSLVLLYLNAAVTHGFALVLGQAKRGFPATFAACAYSCAPLVLLAIPGCGSIIALIWLVVLTGFGLKETHRISTGGAAASVLAPYALACCLIVFAFGALFITARQAVGQP